MKEFDARRGAELLLEARSSRLPLRELPDGARPASMDEAYALQTEVVRALGGTGGWKVVARRANQGPRCSPIPLAVILGAPAELSLGMLPRPEVEVELAVSFVRDLHPGSSPIGDDDILAAIGSFRPALEVLNSRFADRTAVSPFSSLADLLSCAAVVVGESAAEWRQIQLGRIETTLLLNDREVARTELGPARAALIETLTWLANHAAGRADPIRAGHVVITGARVGPIETPIAGTRILGSLTGIGNVSACMTA